MNTKQKLEYINVIIDKINTKVLPKRDFKFSFINKGANDYCIVITKDNKEINSFSFNTYDSVIACLDLIRAMFNESVKEIKSK